MGYDDWKATEPDLYDPGRLRDEHEPEPVEACDECGLPIWFNRVSIAGVGLFCGRHCAAKGTLKHEQRMRRQSA